MEKPRIIFMGTSLLAKEVLNSLFNANYDILAVFTQPDKKIGRKRELVSSPVKLLAIEKGVSVFQPDKLNTIEAERIKSLSPDMIIVAAYGKIIPENILKIPKRSSLNIHASLLPKYRGASPIQNALLNGDETTGITIMLMDAGIDTGDILSQQELSIDSDDTTETLSVKLAALGSELIIKSIPAYIAGEIKSQKQDASLATNCQLIKREDGRIDWNNEAKTIYNKYRAFYPWPGVFSFWDKDGRPMRIKISELFYNESTKTNHQIGEVFQLDDAVCVQTSRGVVLLNKIQAEGKSIAPIKEFLNGYPDFLGSVLK